MHLKRRTALTVIDKTVASNKDEERGRLTLEISGEKRYRLNAAPLASNSVRRGEYRRRVEFLTRFLAARMQFEIRRRRSLITAQGSSVARTLGSHYEKSINPERVRRPPNPFRVNMLFLICLPRVVATLQLWAEISERLRRISNCISASRAHFCAGKSSDGAFTVSPS